MTLFELMVFISAVTGFICAVTEGGRTGALGIAIGAVIGTLDGLAFAAGLWLAARWLLRRFDPDKMKNASLRLLANLLLFLAELAWPLAAGLTGKWLTAATLRLLAGTATS